MKFLKRLNIKIDNGYSYILCILNHKIIQYDVINGKILNIHFCFNKNKEYNLSNKPVFYLKVNRNQYSTIVYLQNWIDIVYKLGYDFFILCDNVELEHLIYRNIHFKTSDIKFLKSNRRLYKKQFGKVFSLKWLHAAQAHLTTFLHSKQNSINAFWNIDADDTQILLDNDKIVELFMKIEAFAQKDTGDIYSLDMWNSRTNGIHWSFGITYTKNKINWLDLVSKNICNVNFIEKYKNCESGLNIDWLFTFFKYNNFANIKTFYFEDLYFKHLYDSVLSWKNNEFYLYRTVKDFIENDNIERYHIAEDCIKFTVEVNSRNNVQYTASLLSVCN